jgi:hypothetical protein
MATIAVTEPNRNGDAKSFVAGASGGDNVSNDGMTLLYFRNTSGGAITVTVDSYKPCDQGADHNETIVVGATTGDEIAGPFSPTRFNDPADNLMKWTYSANPPTGLTVAAVRVRPAP